MEKSEEIRTILQSWNPLGEMASQIVDLDGYEVEAEDILFNVELDFELKSIKNRKDTVRHIVKDVLNETFGLHLSVQDCERYADLIYEIIIRNET